LELPTLHYFSCEPLDYSIELPCFVGIFPAFPNVTALIPAIPTGASFAWQSPQCPDARTTKSGALVFGVWELEIEKTLVIFQFGNS